MKKKQEFTYQSAVTEIIAAMEVREASCKYPDLRAAVTHYLQNPEEIPQ